MIGRESQPIPLGDIDPRQRHIIKHIILLLLIVLNSSIIIVIVSHLIPKNIYFMMYRASVKLREFKSNYKNIKYNNNVINGIYTNLNDIIALKRVIK